MVQQTVQVILTTIWTLFAGPIAEAITPQWWYGLGAALAGVLPVLAFCFLPETKYERSASSYQGEGTPEDVKVGDQPTETYTERPALDFDTYAPRTWKSDLRLWVGSPDWTKVLEVFRVSPRDPPFAHGALP